MTHRNLHRSGRYGKCLGGCFHLQRLMRAPMVTKCNSVADHAAGMLQGFEAMPVHALLLQRSDHALHHAVLLRAVRRYEFLLQP